MVYIKVGQIIKYICSPQHISTSLNEFLLNIYICETISWMKIIYVNVSFQTWNTVHLQKKFQKIIFDIDKYNIKVIYKSAIKFSFVERDLMGENKVDDKDVKNADIFL